MATDVERLKPVGPLADWMRSNTSNIPMLPEVAARVITAIRDDKLYIFTHPGMRDEVEARFAAILAAMDGVSPP